MTTTAPDTQPTAAKPAKTTEYVVLALRTTAEPNGDVWEIVDRHVNAASADAAIKAVGGEKGTVLNAVPTRSWQPRRLDIDMKPVIRLTPA